MNCTSGSATSSATSGATRLNQRRGGFTLREMVVALAVAAALLGWYVRSADEGDSLDDMMRGGDMVRMNRDMGARRAAVLGFNVTRNESGGLVATPIADADHKQAVVEAPDAEADSDADAATPARPDGAGAAGPGDSNPNP